MTQTRANNEQIEINSINGWLPPFFCPKFGVHPTELASLKTLRIVGTSLKSSNKGPLSVGGAGRPIRGGIKPWENAKVTFQDGNNTCVRKSLEMIVNKIVLDRTSANIDFFKWNAKGIGSTGLKVFIGANLKAKGFKLAMGSLKDAIK